MDNETSWIEKKHKKDRLSTSEMVANREDMKIYFNYFFDF